MFGNYLKMAWKVLRRRRFFTFVSLFGIGFTLTALLTVVSIVDHHLAPSYPETELDKMLLLNRMMMFGDRSTWSSGPGYEFIERYGRDLPGVERMTVFTRGYQPICFKDGRKLVFDARGVDAEYWRVMRFAFLEGAPFGVDEDSGAERVAVISDATRRRLFDDAPALGRPIELDGTAYTVVGVVKDVPYYRMSAAADIWIPLKCVTIARFFDSMIGRGEVIYLLEDGVAPAEVQAAFRERLARVEFEHPDRYHTIVGLPMTRLEEASGDFLNLDVGESAPRRLVLFVLLAALAFMALPAINLININLSRIYERSTEIGVRKAFGASGRQLVVQFIVENVVLCLIGGAIGLIGALAVLKLAALAPQTPYMTISLNWRILVAGISLATIFGLLSGVWPAWKMARQHPVTALRGGAS